ncbi:MAG: hypothetical protein ACE5HA_07065 [Anaerolineae bacterium]
MPASIPDNHFPLAVQNTRSADRLFQAPEYRAASIRLLYGSRFPHKLALYGAGRLLMRGETVLVLDGANSTDAYFLCKIARAFGRRPEDVLSCLQVSRAFTCYQMVELVLRELPPAIARTDCSLVLCAGLPATFYDEHVSLPEAMQLLKQVLEQIRTLAEGPTTFVITASEPTASVKGRVVLLDLLKREAQFVCRVERDGTGFVLHREKPDLSTFVG